MYKRFRMGNAGRWKMYCRGAWDALRVDIPQNREVLHPAIRRSCQIRFIQNVNEIPTGLPEAFTRMAFAHFIIFALWLAYIIPSKNINSIP